MNLQLVPSPWLYVGDLVLTTPPDVDPSGDGPLFGREAGDMGGEAGEFGE